MHDIDAQFARAIELEDSGKPEQALEQYRRLLADSPLHADAWHNSGLLLARLGRLVEAERSHREYTRRCPVDARARSDLADVLIALARYGEALTELDAGLRLSPDDAPALVRRGVALSCSGRFDEARQAFGTALARYPQEAARFIRRVTGDMQETAVSPENIFLARRYQAQGQCDWTDWSGYVAEMRRAGAAADVVLEPAVGFMSQHLPLSDAERHAIMRRIAAPIEARMQVLPPPAPRQRKRLRLGVLSPDFCEHLNAYHLLPLFDLVDRDRFEVYAYSLTADDGSQAGARIRAAADRFRDLTRLGDREAAAVIREDDVDILLDVAGHTTGSRFAITAQRPARRQVNYFGFPSSLGSRRVDFAIVDRVSAPDASSWSESLIHLPHTFFLYDFRAPPPGIALTRRDYGLPDDAFVFCAFHKGEKITPECFFPWMEILRRVPRSVLWLRGLAAETVANLRRAAQSEGVDGMRLLPAAFEPRDRFLARHRLGDLMLDAFNHNALTTACDSLGMALPVLTLGGGNAFSNRGGEGIVRAAGLPDLVAAGREEYVRMAVELAENPGALREIKDRLQRNRASAPLFDTAGRVRELEAAFAQML